MTNGTGPIFWICLAFGTGLLFSMLLVALDTEFQARMGNKWRLFAKTGWKRGQKSQKRPFLTLVDREGRHTYRTGPSKPPEAPR